jgi:hypothetical protein
LEQAGLEQAGLEQAGCLNRGDGMGVVTNVVVEGLETRLPKVIDARTHGIIDYCHAAFFFGMAWVCRKSEPRASLAAAVTGTFILAEAMLTDYPLGVKKVIPFEAHGKMDAAMAGASFLVPRIFGFSETPAAKVFQANGFAEGAIVGMTDFDSASARVDENPMGTEW